MPRASTRNSARVQLRGQSESARVFSRSTGLAAAAPARSDRRLLASQAVPARQPLLAARRASLSPPPITDARRRSETRLLASARGRMTPLSAPFGCRAKCNSTGASLRTGKPHRSWRRSTPNASATREATAGPRAAEFSFHLGSSQGVLDAVAAAPPSAVIPRAVGRVLFGVARYLPSSFGKASLSGGRLWEGLRGPSSSPQGSSGPAHGGQALGEAHRLRLHGARGGLPLLGTRSVSKTSRLYHTVLGHLLSLERRRRITRPMRR